MRPSSPRPPQKSPAIYLLFAVPAMGAALGVHYLVKHYQPVPIVGTDGKGADRKIATTGKADRDTHLGDREPKHPRVVGKHVAAAGSANSADEEEEAEGEELAVEEKTHESATPEKSTSPEAWANNDQVGPNSIKPSDGSCTSVEYPGAGPHRTQITQADWNRVIAQFHQAKARLTGWLKRHKAELPLSTVEAMVRQARAIRIQRPPSVEEPDLTWRGIGVLSQTAEGVPLIRVGGGFVELSKRSPERARFELTRLAAQAWAPCELQKIAGVAPAWDPLLKCLGVSGSDSQACGLGTFSDAGWAVSSTVAYAVSPPGCKLPAFLNPELASCAAHIPLLSGTKEARL